MKKSLKCYILLIFSLIYCLFIIDINAQFQIDAQYRFRFEYRDGYKKLASTGSVPSFLISQRSRISFSYQSENLLLKFTPQDVRVWGDEQLSSTTGVFGDNAALDLFEAYAEIKLASFSWASIGRQQLVYDHERLLASRNWNQNGISYDALLFKIKSGEWNIHLAGSWNSLSETSSNNFYQAARIKSLNFLWINRKFGGKSNLSFLHIASGVTEADTTNTLHFRQTAGVFTDFKGDNLTYRANAYYQFGRNREDRAVSAFLIDADIAYKFGKFTMGFGLGYLSGNKDITNSTDHLFDVLYGARHRYFGLLDYFQDFPSQTRQGGLIDLYAYLNYKFSENVSLRNSGHFFQLAQTNQITPGDKELGYENDLELSYKFNEWGTIKAAYLFYSPTEAYKILQSVDDAKFSQFVFMELTLTPRLYKQEFKQELIPE